MTDDEQRIADLVELHALCARYMSYTSQFVEDRWLDVFTPDAEYNVFGTPYTLERFPALLAAAPRGQFIGNMPVVELDGDRATGMQHFVFIDQQTHAMRLGWYATSTAAPPTAGASTGARPRSCASTAASTPGASTIRSPTRVKGDPVTELPKIISVDDHVVEPAHLWQDRLPAAHARAAARASSGRAGATSRSPPARRTSRR